MYVILDIWLPQKTLLSSWSISIIYKSSDFLPKKRIMMVMLSYCHKLLHSTYTLVNIKYFFAKISSFKLCLLEKNGSCFLKFQALVVPVTIAICMWCMNLATCLQDIMWALYYARSNRWWEYLIWQLKKGSTLFGKNEMPCSLSIKSTQSY